MLEKTTQINVLYDFYHSLLTEKQRHFMELYYHDDLSLREIAEQSNVSRQAVFEHLKRAEQLLLHYEEQLQLASKYDERQRLLEQLQQTLKETNASHSEPLLKLVEALKNVD